MLGLKASDEAPRRRPGLEPEERAFLERKIAELKGRITEGGLREAGIRAMLYIGLGDAFVDERGFAVLRRARVEHKGLPLAEFKQKLREQFYMLVLDQEGAVSAIPGMLPDDFEQRQKWFAVIREIVLAAGEPSEERRRRLARVAGLFGVDAVKPVATMRKKGAAA
ncbi:MAG: hypothetical protein ACREWE_15865 [Gammaproteobacteria bacterium]